jgi:hypothetical protein
MHLGSKLFAVALLAVVASSASAASVTYTLDLSVDNAWKVFADVSDDDNFGIASYSFKLVGNTLSHDNASPRTTSPTAPSEGLPAGFTLLRSSDDTDAGVESNITISASQDTVGTLPNPHLVYGFGQEASNFGAEGITPGGIVEGNPWAEPLLLAQGTYARAEGTLTFDQAAALTFVNVFTVADNPEDEINPPTAAATTEIFNIIPFGEPTGEAPTVVDVTISPPALPDTNNANEPAFNPFTHQFALSNAGTATQPVAWANLQFTGYTAAYSGSGGDAADAAATLSPTGLFSWNANGAPRGIYNWSVVASNSVGSDTGTIQIHINAVPEPSTLALFGLAMVGGIGLVRRRNG